MKTHLLTGVPAGLLSVALGTFCVAAPEPPAEHPKELPSCEGHISSITGVAFSPDGKMLASASSMDGPARLWDVKTAKCTAILKGHTEGDGRFRNVIAVSAVAFSRDGKTVATGSYDRTVKLWDAANGKNTATLKGHRCPVTSVAFSPDGKTLASADQEGVRLWDLATRKEMVARASPSRYPQLVAYGATNKPLTVTIDPHTIYAFSVGSLDPEEAPVTCKVSPRAMLSCVALSRDGKTAASTARDRWLRLWDVFTGVNTVTFPRPPGEVHSLAFSPDGKVLACAYSEPPSAILHEDTVRLYELPSGKILTTLKGRISSFVSLAFSPDGRLLAVGGLGTIRIWRLPLRYAADD